MHRVPIKPQGAWRNTGRRAPPNRCPPHGEWPPNTEHDELRSSHEQNVNLAPWLHAQRFCLLCTRRSSKSALHGQYRPDQRQSSPPRYGILRVGHSAVDPIATRNRDPFDRSSSWEHDVGRCSRSRFSGCTNACGHQPCGPHRDPRSRPCGCGKPIQVTLGGDGTENACHRRTGLARAFRRRDHPGD